MNCADCNGVIGHDDGPPDGWQLEDGRTVCHSCCVRDTKQILQTVATMPKDEMLHYGSFGVYDVLVTHGDTQIRIRDRTSSEAIQFDKEDFLGIMEVLTELMNDHVDPLDEGD